MSEMNYTPNSHAYKEAKQQEQQATEPDKKIEKVVSGTAKVKKKNELQKLAGVFISEDAKNVKTYVFSDILVPAIKKAIVDIVTDGINMFFYGGTGRGRSSSSGSKVSYRSYYDRKDDRYNDSRPKTGYSYDEIILETRGEAEEVLSQLSDLIDTYRVATVADLYDLVGITHNYTDNKYGWTNIRNAEAQRCKDGYMLKLPKPIPINN